MKILIRDRRNGDWYWVHKVVLSEYASKIGAVALAVYNVLCSFADNDNQCAFPSQKKIGEILGYSRETINKAIKVLESHNLIEVNRTRYCCIYYILKVRCEAQLTSETPDVKQKNTRCEAGFTSDVKQGSHYQELYKKNQLSTQLEAEAIYSLYPKKADKKNSIRAIVKLLKQGIKADTLITCVNNYKVYIETKGIDRDYIIQSNHFFESRWEEFREVSLEIKGEDELYAE